MDAREGGWKSGIPHSAALHAGYLQIALIVNRL
jgi:hypothetical protein